MTHPGDVVELLLDRGCILRVGMLDGERMMIVLQDGRGGTSRSDTCARGPARVFGECVVRMAERNT